MNSKTNLIFLIIMGLFLTALVTRNGALALMALPFVFFLGAGLLSFSRDVRLHASRVLSCYRSEANMPTTMILTIENDGSAVPCLQIREQVLSKIKVIDGILELRVVVPTKKSVELRYTFQAPRGRYTWQQIRVVASDPFGLFEKTLDLPAAAEVHLLPEQLTLKWLRFQPRHTLHTTGLNLSRLPGSGIDFWGVREYRPGDSLRRIHWRLSARHPQMFFSKEFEREEMADIGLLLDARIATNLVYGTDNLVEYSIQAATALAKGFLTAGNRVSMLVLGKQLVRVFPGIGKRQLICILETLASCEPGEKVSFDTLKYLPVRLFPSHSLIVVISPLRRNDLNPISRLRAEGYQVLLVSPNPVQFAARERTANSSKSFAIRAARLERTILLWRIRQLGIEVIDWPVEQSLLKTICSMHWARM